MKRSAFLGFLAAVPFVGRFFRPRRRPLAKSEIIECRAYVKNLKSFVVRERRLLGSTVFDDYLERISTMESTLESLIHEA